MRKKCAYFLVAALSVSMLAGCGSKSKGADNSTKKEAKSEKVSVGLSDVLANIAEAATGIESVKLEANGEAEVVISMSGQEMTATGNINLASNAVKADPAFDVKGTAEYNPSLPLANKKWSLFGSIFFNKYAVFPVDMWLLDF